MKNILLFIAAFAFWVSFILCCLYLVLCFLSWRWLTIPNGIGWDMVRTFIFIVSFITALVMWLKKEQKR